jgi:hypothetical protein
VGAEPEIVVRAEIEHRLFGSLHGDLGSLRGGNDPFPLVEPRFLDVVQLLLEHWL